MLDAKHRERFAALLQGEIKLKDLDDTEALAFANALAAIPSDSIEIESSSPSLHSNPTTKQAKTYLQKTLDQLDKGLKEKKAGGIWLVMPLAAKRVLMRK
jgi:hypothetical protein